MMDFANGANAIRRAGFEFLVSDQDYVVLPGHHQRFLESRIGLIECAHASSSGNSTRTNETVVEIHFRHDGNRAGVDATAHMWIDSTANHDQLQIFALHDFRGDSNGVRRDSDPAIGAEEFNDRQIRAAIVEKNQLTRLNQRSRDARERILPAASLVDTHIYGRGCRRDGQGTAVDPAASAFGCKRPEARWRY